MLRSLFKAVVYQLVFLIRPTTIVSQHPCNQRYKRTWLNKNDGNFTLGTSLNASLHVLQTFGLGFRIRERDCRALRRDSVVEVLGINRLIAKSRMTNIRQKPITYHVLVCTTKRTLSITKLYYTIEATTEKSCVYTKSKRVIATKIQLA